MDGSRQTAQGDGSVDPALLDALSLATTAAISDSLSRLPGAVGLRPYHSHARVMVGQALTVRTAAGDNLMIYKALDILQPGQVIVVDGGADISRALFGELLAALAVSRGAAGIVIDGAVRDAVALASSDFPVFARATTPRGPYRNGPGELDVPVSIGGMVVSPNDIVVGDPDGVVSFPGAICRTVLDAVRDKQQREAALLENIRNGTYRPA